MNSTFPYTAGAEESDVGLQQFPDSQEGVGRSSAQTWAEAEGYLRRAQRILAITHLSPDGDAIGSLLAFGRAMQSLGKSVTMACQDSAHPRFSYLSGVRDFHQNGDGAYDLLVSIDASDLQRLGTIFLPVEHARAPMIVFDHHITNTQFGVVNVVDSNAASSAEIIFKLLRRMDIRITAEIATALLTGIITDTLAFRTSSTTPDTLATAMDLMRAGASLPEITRRALVLRSYDSIRFLAAGIVASQLEDGIVYATITRKMRKELGVKEDRGDAGLVGTLITAMEANVAAVFVENIDGSIDVGFRSEPGYDVSQVAFEFGGGGHTVAAGCTLPGPMRDAVNRVLVRLRRMIREK
ncbi:MAG: bifunctional oligoribonuclease/PAP phosphatase NrnA [Chloroflexi bacterium]|nr:bifunctional oligoribonuclease/PAP phosphatase NrnA [Chloroflexota bacterium]MCL5275959.1 bifunctional oligoribonuclease/PAP phosphatase NrnA [Chloroflexota bacterium]